MTTIELQVTGMTCGGCAASVKRALQRRDENARVDVDLASGRVQVEGALTVEQAQLAVTEAGFGIVGAQQR
jgi:copper chaperone